MVKCVLLLLCYHLVLHVGGAVNDFTPIIYKAQSMFSAECISQHNSFHDEKLIKILQQVKQCIQD